MQKSELPTHARVTFKKEHHPNGQEVQKPTLETDPYAAPNVYYGASHAPRKVAKSRTYSAHDNTINPVSPTFKAPLRRQSHGQSTLTLLHLYEC